MLHIQPAIYSQYPGRKNLFEVVDYVVDTKMPERDAVLQFPGLAAWTSPVSTILNAFVIEALVGETVKALLDLGQIPMVWTSANIPGGDEANRAIIQRYSGRVRWL